MRHILAIPIALLALSGAALAQQPAKVTLEFSHDGLNVLSQALDAMPYRLAAPLINDIQQQIKAQRATAPAPERPAAPVEAK